MTPEMSNSVIGLGFFAVFYVFCACCVSNLVVQRFRDIVLGRYINKDYYYYYYY